MSVDVDAFVLLVQEYVSVIDADEAG